MFTVDGGLAIANHEAFDGGIREAAHAVGFEYGPRRWSRRSSARPASASRMMVKLASATPMASQVCRQRRPGIVMPGSGRMDDARPSR